MWLAGGARCTSFFPAVVEINSRGGAFRPLPRSIRSHPIPSHLTSHQAARSNLRRTDVLYPIHALLLLGGWALEMFSHSPFGQEVGPPPLPPPSVIAFHCSKLSCRDNNEAFFSVRNLDAEVTLTPFFSPPQKSGIPRSSRSPSPSSTST